VAVHGTVFLTEAGHVKRRQGETLKMGRHAEQRPHRDHAGAAYTAYHEIKSVRVQRPEDGLRQRREQFVILGYGLHLAQPGIVNREERGAKPVDATVVLVAA
jgi:hypothetical protein